jgi:hypothetical protein
MANHVEPALDARAVAAELESRIAPLMQELRRAVDDRLHQELQAALAGWRAQQSLLY